MHTVWLVKNMLGQCFFFFSSTSQKVHFGHKLLNHMGIAMHFSILFVSIKT